MEMASQLENPKHGSSPMYDFLNSFSAYLKWVDTLTAQLAPKIITE